MSCTRRVAGILIGASLAAAALAAACGGGDDGASPTAGAGTAAAGTAPVAATTPAGATATATRSAATATAAGGSSDDAIAFGALVSKLGRAEYSVTYDIDITESGQSFKGEVALFRGTDRSRIDFAGSIGTTPFRGTSIRTPAKTYLCLVADGTGACIEVTPGTVLPIPDPGREISTRIDDFSANAGSWSIMSAAPRTIAGASARCFEFSGPEGAGTACFSDEGLILLMSIEGPRGKMTFEASAYRASVRDADFEPPYPVQKPS